MSKHLVTDSCGNETSVQTNVTVMTAYFEYQMCRRKICFSNRNTAKVNEKIVELKLSWWGIILN